MDDLAIDSSRQRTNLSGKDSSVSLPTMRSYTQLLVLPLVPFSCFITPLLNNPPLPQINKKELDTFSKHTQLNSPGEK